MAYVSGGQGPVHGPEHGSRVNRRLLAIMKGLVSIPFLLLPRRGRPVRTKAIHEMHPMAYLDALRGYLALVIFTGHTMSRFWKWIPQSILAIPWLQFPFRGGFASLDIFFWISGYAITFKIVGLMQAKRSDQLLDALASSIFRRYFRLFLPIIPVVLVTALAVRTGVAIPPQEKVDLVTGNPVWFWVKDVGHILNPFTHILGYWDGRTGSELLDHTWTLSAEFRSSMIMFLLCTGTCKLPTWKRKLLLWAVIPPFVAWQANWAAMAFLGMWFSECRQQKRQRQPVQGLPLSQTNMQADGRPFTEHDKTKHRTSAFTGTSNIVSSLRHRVDVIGADRWRTFCLVGMFLYSFIVLKDPYDTDKMTLFPHNYLNLLVPDHWHAQMRMHMHLGMGALMMLYPLDRLTFLQRPLLLPFSQFLGELSFGIYAVHITVRWIVWEPRYVKWALARYGGDAFDHFWIAFPGWFGMAVLVLWSAELFRKVDMQVLKFCKHLELWMFE